MIARAIVASIVFAAAGPATAQAQQVASERDRERIGFAEARGGWGFQFGETDYVPDGPPGDFKHPLTNGFAVGGTAGVFITTDLAAIASYEFARAQSRSGETEGAVADIDGEISYHTALVGARLHRALGPGEIVGELGAGIVFPFETELTFEYDEALEPLGITGEGTRVTNYNVGYGGRAMFGFRLPIVEELYVSNYVALEAFQSSNNGRETELENFVTDFEQEPPEPTTAVIEFDDDGGEQPSTYPVSSVRVQLALGYQF